MSNGKVTLGYWGIRGRGQIPRLLLAYTGATWEDVQYTDPSQWFGADRQKLGFDFPNLPYIIDGDLKITQTSAVCDYIIERSNKHQLVGVGLQERAKIGNLIYLVNDIIQQVAHQLYDAHLWGNREHLYKSFVEPKLLLLAKYKGNKEWLYSHLTVADFIVAELSYYIEQIYPEEYKKHPWLQQIRDSFNNINEIKTYYQQEWAVKAPFTSLPYSQLKF